MLVVAVFAHGVTLADPPAGLRRPGLGADRRCPCCSSSWRWLFFFDTTLRRHPDRRDARRPEPQRRRVVGRLPERPGPGAGAARASCWRRARRCSSPSSSPTGPRSGSGPRSRRSCPPARSSSSARSSARPSTRSTPPPSSSPRCSASCCCTGSPGRRPAPSWLTADIERGSAERRCAPVRCSRSRRSPPGVRARSPAARRRRAGRRLVAGLRDRTGSRVTISPLVNIQDRLVNQSDLEVFTVRSTEPAYWRLTSLDTFEGDIWRSGGKYQAADGDLAVGRARGRPHRPTSISATRSRTWRSCGCRRRSSPGSSNSPDGRGALPAGLVDADRRHRRRRAPTASSTTSGRPAPSFSGDMLRGGVPGDPPGARRPLHRAARRTSAPPPRSLADQIVTERCDHRVRPGARPPEPLPETASTPTTSPSPRGHGESAIDEFLSGKRGYCEQFAGTYAAMARSLGLPARVAVGFTPGESTAGDPTLYRVNGKQRPRLARGLPRRVRLGRASSPRPGAARRTPSPTPAFPRSRTPHRRPPRAPRR